MKKIVISTLIFSLFFISGCGKIKLTQEDPIKGESNNESIQDLENMPMDDMSDIDDMSRDIEDIFKDIENTDVSGESNISTDSNINIPKPLEESTFSQATRAITLDAFEFGYSPSSLKLKAGEKVKLTLNNSGKMKHDWVLEGTAIKTKIIDGGTSTVYEFTAPAKGNYKAYCSVGKHRAAGMEMNVVVE